MTDQQIIKACKDKSKVQAFGLCPSEMQAMFAKAGLKNCKQLAQVPVLAKWVSQNASEEFYHGRTYTINEDWEPEQKYRTRPVLKGDYGCYYVEVPRTKDIWNVMVAASDKDFNVYFYDQPDQPNASRAYISPHCVANAMAGGKEVFGNFREP